MSQEQKNNSNIIEGLSENILKYIVLGGSFLVLLVPLIVADSFFFPFIFGKAIFFRILSLIIFSAWLILFLKDRKYAPKFTWISLVATIFTLSILVSDILSPNSIKSIWSNFERMEGWMMIVHLWMYFIAVSSTFSVISKSKENIWKYFLNTSLGVSIVICIYGVWQLLGFAEIHQGGVRLDATLGNAAYLAVYCLVHSFLALFLAFRERNKIWKWIYGIVALLEAYIMINTATRGSFLGLLIGCLVSASIYAIFEKENKKIRKWAIGIIISIFALVGIFILIKDTKLIQESRVFSRLANISISDTKTQARAFTWKMALEGFQEKPVLGWGQESFNYIFNKDYDPHMWMHEQWFDRAHSVFLDWLVAGGVVGLLLYISLYLLAFFYIWKSSLNLKEKSVLIGLLIAYGIHNVFVFDNISSYVLFFSLLAYIHSISEGKILFQNIKINKDINELIIMPAIILIAIFGLYYLEYKPFVSNTTLIKAMTGCVNGRPSMDDYKQAIGESYNGKQEVREQLMICTERIINAKQASAEMKKNWYIFLRGEISNQIEETPNDARIYILTGAFLNRIGELNDAVTFLEKAHELSPGKQNPIFELGLNYINRRDFSKGLEYFKQAYDLDPTYPEAIKWYASGLIFNNRAKEALVFMKDNPNLQYEQAIINAYANIKDYDKVISIYENVLKDDPQNTQVKASLAATYLSKGMPSKAIQILSEISKDNPSFKEKIDQYISQIKSGKTVLEN